MRNVKMSTFKVFHEKFKHTGLLFFDGNKYDKKNEKCLLLRFSMKSLTTRAFSLMVVFNLINSFTSLFKKLTLAM